ncbi:MAG: hypothetical protein U1F61_07170 [Opitutaceae bacterium]
MKPRIGTAFLLFLSSYAPLLVLVAVLDFDWSKKQFGSPYLDLSLVIIAVLSGLMPFISLKGVQGGQIYQVNDLKNRSGDLVNYALPYLVTFIGLKVSEPTSIIGFAFFMVLFGALSIKTQALWINPLLALGDYRLYEAVLQAEGNAPQTVQLLAPKPLAAGQRCRAVFLTDTQVYVTEFIDPSPSVEDDRPETNIHPDQED